MDLEKKTATIANLAADDRFKKNTQQIAADMVKIREARDALQSVLDIFEANRGGPR